MKKKVSLVIGSGGIKTAASIGIMQVLQDEGIELEMVVGCSGGAVFGAAIALGYSPEQMDLAREKAWTTDITSSINYKYLAGILAPRVFGFDEKFAIFDDRTFMENADIAWGKDTKFEDTQIPFYCVATDFFTGKPYVISTGLLKEAIRVSSGIPLIFAARELQGRHLIDGALSDPLPVDVAIREGADVIIAIGFESSIESEIKSLGNFTGQMFNILVNQLMRQRLAFYNLAHYSELILIVPEFEGKIRVNDVDRVPEIIEKGKIEAQKQLPHIKRLLSE